MNTKNIARLIEGASIDLELARNGRIDQNIANAHTRLAQIADALALPDGRHSTAGFDTLAASIRARAAAAQTAPPPPPPFLAGKATIRPDADIKNADWIKRVTPREPDSEAALDDIGALGDGSPS